MLKKCELSIVVLVQFNSNYFIWIPLIAFFSKIYFINMLNKLSKIDILNGEWKF